MANYKPLSESFTKKGWDFKRVDREGNVAIYEVSKGNFISYEVILIQKHNGIKYPNGAYCEPAEFYPPSSSWGINGFTYRSLTNAREKYKSLLNK